MEHSILRNEKFIVSAYKEFKTSLIFLHDYKSYLIGRDKNSSWNLVHFQNGVLLEVANRTPAPSLGEGTMQLATRRKGPLKPEVNQGGPMSLPVAPVLYMALTTYSHPEFKRLNLKGESSFSYI